MSDVFEMFGVEPEAEAGLDPKVQQALADLALAVGDLQHAEFKQEPSLHMVAVAVQDVLEAAGYRVPGLDRWVLYEMSGRRSSKLEEARARADAAYRNDLEAIEDGWVPLTTTKQSRLLWRRPGLPTGLSRPPPDEPDDPPAPTPTG